MSRPSGSSTAPRTLSDLRVYVAARELARDVTSMVKQWPFPARHDDGRQLVRAAKSIAQNVAEAYGRHYPKEKQRFLYIARGSAREVEGWLNSALDDGLIDADTHRRYIHRLVRIVRMLNAYARTFNTEKPRAP